MTLNMIWAMDKNRLIGRDNELPWHIPADLKYFKKTTKGKTVIMGLNTFHSIGKALPKRRNIVLNFDNIDLEGAEVFTSIPDAIEEVKDEDAFIIGGRSIYKQFLDKVDRLYITHIDHEYEGNVYFPEFDMDKWEMVSEERKEAGDDTPVDLYFRIYERK